MLDVHPAHHAAATWRDFFIHIATICIGLLIAIGLEQSVEKLHRHYERVELLEGLNRESEQIVQDADASEKYEWAFASWARQARQQVASNLRDHTAYTRLPQQNLPPATDVPNDRVYKAAMTSGKLSLLSDQEVAAYGELDQVIIREYKAIDRAQEITASLGDSFRIVGLHQSKDDPAVYTAIPAEELQKLYIALGQREDSERTIFAWEVAAGGAAAVMLKGERDLSKIQHAERPDPLPIPH